VVPTLDQALNLIRHDFTTVFNLQFRPCFGEKGSQLRKEMDVDEGRVRKPQDVEVAATGTERSPNPPVHQYQCLTPILHQRAPGVGRLDVSSPADEQSDAKL
jgi:hypothetical protein